MSDKIFIFRQKERIIKTYHVTAKDQDEAEEIFCNDVESLAVHCVEEIEDDYVDWDYIGEMKATASKPTEGGK